MDQTGHRSPYRKAVPQWATAPALLLLYTLQAFVTGLNSSVVSKVTSFYGMEAATVHLFLNMGAIGSVAIIPLSYRFRDFFRRKDLLLSCFLLQGLISYASVHPWSPMVLLAGNFFMGMLHFICVIDIISLMVERFPFMKSRPLFYGCFYGFSRVIMEVVAYVWLKEVEGNSWTAVFTISFAAAMSCALLSVLLFHRERLQRKIPLYQVDWPGLLLFVTASSAFCYVLTMGRSQDWFESGAVKIASAVFVLSLVLFIYRQYTVKRPYWNLSVFHNYRQVALGFFLMVVMYFFYLSAFLLNQYVVYNFREEAHYLGRLLLVTMAAYGVFFPVAGWWLNKGVSKRIMLSMGFLFYGISLIVFYHIIQTSVAFNDLLIPFFLQGVGNTFTLTTLSTFMATNVARGFNKDRVMGSLTARSLLGMFLCSSLYSNWLYRGTAVQEVALKTHLTADNLLVMEQLHHTAAGLVSKGADAGQAAQIALNLVNKRVHIQAFLVAMKDIVLVLGIGAVLVAVAVLFIRRLEMHAVSSQNQYRLIPW